MILWKVLLKTGNYFYTNEAFEAAKLLGKEKSDDPFVTISQPIEYHDGGLKVRNGVILVVPGNVVCVKQVDTLNEYLGWLDLTVKSESDDD